MDQVSLEQQEQILKSNRDLIINRLEADDVIDELIQKDVIGPHAAERLQLANATRTDKNRIIFDQLSTCGPDGLGEFCDILRRKKRQLFIAQQLEKSECNCFACCYMLHAGFILGGWERAYWLWLAPLGNFVLTVNHPTQ